MARAIRDYAGQHPAPLEVRKMNMRRALAALFLCIIYAAALAGAGVSVAAVYGFAQYAAAEPHSGECSECNQ